MRSSSKKRATHACPDCGHAMTYETRDDHVEYRGERRTFKTTAWWCSKCQESIQDGSALKAAERAFVELRAEVDAILLPEQVTEVREQLGISQREAGRLLGGGPRAFQKYESGKVPVSEPMKNLLILLRNDPGRLAELKTVDAVRSRKTRSGPGVEPGKPASKGITRQARVPGGPPPKGRVEWIGYAIETGSSRGGAKRSATVKKKVPETRAAHRRAGR